MNNPFFEKMFQNSHCDAGWHDLLNQAFCCMDPRYLKQLEQDTHWLPGLSKGFSAWTLPLEKVRFILMGESPYPRAESANGYAFWDNSVQSLWSQGGLSKPVNKATSLRNWIKMLLLSRGELNQLVSQQAIARLDKSHLVQTAEQLFRGMMKKGILLLNASLVYSEGKVQWHAKHWRPFMLSFLDQIAQFKPDVQLILLGKLAESIPQDKLPVGLLAEHPYNVSFITNTNVLAFFKPLDLLLNDTD